MQVADHVTWRSMSDHTTAIPLGQLRCAFLACTPGSWELSASHAHGFAPHHESGNDIGFHVAVAAALVLYSIAMILCPRWAAHELVTRLSRGGG